MLHRAVMDRQMREHTLNVAAWAVHAGLSPRHGSARYAGHAKTEADLKASKE